jgi:hypothetical protein
MEYEPPPQPSNLQDDGTPYEEESDEGEPMRPTEGHTEVTMEELHQGVDLHDETPEEARVEFHPTPDHPTGRTEP